MNMPLVCTSKNIWAELSYEVGPSCLIKLGRVGMGRVLCGPSWHGPSWFWAELSVILPRHRVVVTGKVKVKLPTLAFSTFLDNNNNSLLCRASKVRLNLK